jgi:hypothetical protein
MIFNYFMATFISIAESFQFRLSVDDCDMTILGNLASLSGYFLFNLEDLLFLGSISLGSWETYLFVDELLVTCE